MVSLLVVYWEEMTETEMGWESLVVVVVMVDGDRRDHGPLPDKIHVSFRINTSGVLLTAQLEL